MFEDYTVIGMQSERDRARIEAIGADPHKVSVFGNLKYDAPPLSFEEEELKRLQAEIGDRPLWVAASTHPGEEEPVLEAHRMLVCDHPGLLTIIAPRHPERGTGIRVDGYRSRGDIPPAEGIWVADTLGELGLLYRLTRLASRESQPFRQATHRPASGGIVDGQGQDRDVVACLRPHRDGLDPSEYPTPNFKSATDADALSVHPRRFVGLRLDSDVALANCQR